MALFLHLKEVDLQTGLKTRLNSFMLSRNAPTKKDKVKTKGGKTVFYKNRI